MSGWFNSESDAENWFRNEFGVITWHEKEQKEITQKARTKVKVNVKDSPVLSEPVSNNAAKFSYANAVKNDREKPTRREYY